MTRKEFEGELIAARAHVLNVLSVAKKQKRWGILEDDLEDIVHKLTWWIEL